MADRHRVRTACRLRAELGEAPVWIDGALWCVDIKRRHVFRLDPAGGAPRRWEAPEMVSWVLPRTDGGMLAGLASGVHAFDPAIGAFSPVALFERERRGNRLNDACVDRAGRLWLTTQDDAERAPAGGLYRADAAGIARLDDGIVVANGPALSPDGRTLYHTDTPAGLIFASDLADDGRLEGTRVFARVDPRDGLPDGPSVDAEGGVWTGLYGGGAARRYLPTGQVADEVRFPASNVTKVAFGGPDLRTGYATTARWGLSRWRRVVERRAGDLFAFDPGVAGLPCPMVGAIGPARPAA